MFHEEILEAPGTGTGNLRVQVVDHEAVGRRIHLLALTQNSAHGWHFENLWSGKCEELALLIATLTFAFSLLYMGCKKTESPTEQGEEL